jgi:hypothetical protein
MAEGDGKLLALSFALALTKLNNLISTVLESLAASWANISQIGFL